MFRRISGIAASALLLGFVACSDDNPSGGFDVPAYGDSSSSVETVPGSSDGVGMSSSVVGGESSSSVIVNSSSSAKTPKNTAACLWRGFDKKTYVNTGFVNEDIDNYAGLWYNFGDDSDGGMSFLMSARLKLLSMNAWKTCLNIMGDIVERLSCKKAS